MNTIDGHVFEYGTVRKFREQDLPFIMFDLIQEDLDFIAKLPGDISPENYVYATVMSSSIACTILDENGEVGCIVGARGTDKLGVGEIWFFSCSRFFNSVQSVGHNPAAAYEFLRNSLDLIDFMHCLFPVLRCASEKSNEKANRRTKFMGFELSHSCENFNYYTRSYNGGN